MGNRRMVHHDEEVNVFSISEHTLNALNAVSKPIIGVLYEISDHLELYNLDGIYLKIRFFSMKF